LIYGSVCSGIEAASAAWKDLPGWEPKWFSEIDPYCNALLKEKYGKHNFGSLENIDESKIADQRKTELLVGGTPCQSFSINGLQAGLGHANGILAISFLELAGKIKPRWIVWENVVGVLSCNGGEDFATIVETLVKFGYGVCWRVLDARNFGVPQVRRRVFVVGHLGDWRPSAAVLFESSQSQSITNEGEQARTSNNAISGEEAISNSINRNVVEKRVETTLGWAGDETTKVTLGVLPTLKSQQGGEGTGICTSDPLVVRRLTITEYERAMGFPDGYTEIKNFSTRVRQKALGNSMAVPVMRWIGERIQEVEIKLKENNMAKRLTPDDVEKIKTLGSEGKTATEIAVMLGRTPSCISQRLNKIRSGDESKCTEKNGLPTFSSLLNEKAAVKALHDVFQNGNFTKDQFIEALKR